MLNKFIITALAGAIALGATTAGAAEAEYVIKDELTRTECGDCHMGFPPNRLTSVGWKKIMAGLKDHFGEDASLDPKTVKHIEAYLVSKAMDSKPNVPTKMKLAAWKKKGINDPIRITETPYWTRHHGSPKYKRMTKEVKYARGVNCIICHKNAERGTYEEFPGLYGYD